MGIALMQTAINMFTLRDIDEPLPRVLERVADAGYDGVEFLHRLPDADADAVAEVLDATDLAVPGAHLGPFVGLDEMPDAFEETVDTYEAVGCETLAVSIGEERLQSNRVDDTARRLADLADRAADHGMDLLYHNHHWEFQTVDGRTLFDRLLDATDDRVGVELDVGWAAAGGADPVERIESLDDRLELLHIKDADVAARESVEVGEGDVDLDACVEAGLDTGVEWFVYEHDEPDDPFDSLTHGERALGQLAANVEVES